MAWIGKIFSGKSNKTEKPAPPPPPPPQEEPTQSSTVSAIHRAQDAIAVLETKEALQQKKYDDETEKAKKAMLAKDKKLALLCMKRRKVIENSLTNLSNQKMSLETTLVALENMAITKEVAIAQRTATDVLKTEGDRLNIDKIEGDIDDLQDLIRQQTELAELLGNVHDNADIDEDDLGAEMDMLMKADAGTEAVASKPVSEPLMPEMPSVPTTKLPEVKQKVDDEDAAMLARLEAELTA